MPYSGLADFLEALERDKQLVRVEVEVDPLGELGEVVRRTGADPLQCGPALLFARVAGREWPVVANVYGAETRILRALGAASSDELAERLSGLGEAPAADPGMFARLRRRGPGAASASPTRLVKSAPCQQVVRLGRDIDLAELPLPRCGSDGERPTITAAQLITREPQGTNVAVANVPAVLLGPSRLGLPWHPASECARHWSLARAAGEPLPVAIVLGACASFSIAGEAALPPGYDAYRYAAALRGGTLELAKGRSQSIEPPADAEVVIEGLISTDAEHVSLGDFVSPLGQRIEGAVGPQVTVTAVTHRANPVFPARIAGWPWHEIAALRRLALRLLLPWARQVSADLIDFDAPHFGGGKVIFASMQSRFAGHARQVAAALSAWPAMAGIKLLVLVDESIHPADSDRVWAQVASHCDLSKDLFEFSGPADPLDGTGAGTAASQLTAIDATLTGVGESGGCSKDASSQHSAEIAERVVARWQQYGLGAVAKNPSQR
jgi:4-hydroxy-3-polyprenylbenzoate decarboxylase